MDEKLKSSRIVERNISTALILEDDVDWDMRIKDQMQDFALSIRMMLRSGSKSSIGEAELNRSTASLSPSSSPYGDGWDVLWFGHCGAAIPDKTNGRVVHRNDGTVPEHQHMRIWSKQLLYEYEPHTRIVYRAVEGAVCTFAYAVTQAAARRILYLYGLRSFDEPYDIMLNNFCQHDSVCFMVQPQLFNHHRAAGNVSADSDIQDTGNDVRKQAFTEMIRLSTRLNLENVLAGRTLEDQWPDRKEL